MAQLEGATSGRDPAQVTVLGLVQGEEVEQRRGVGKDEGANVVLRSGVLAVELVRVFNLRCEVAGLASLERIVRNAAQRPVLLGRRREWLVDQTVEHGNSRLVRGDVLASRRSRVEVGPEADPLAETAVHDGKDSFRPVRLAVDLPFALGTGIDAIDPFLDPCIHHGLILAALAFSLARRRLLANGDGLRWRQSSHSGRAIVRHRSLLLSCSGSIRQIARRRGGLASIDDGTAVFRLLGRFDLEALGRSVRRLEQLPLWRGELVLRLGRGIGRARRLFRLGSAGGHRRRPRAGSERQGRNGRSAWRRCSILPNWSIADRRKRARRPGELRHRRGIRVSACLSVCTRHSSLRQLTTSLYTFKL